MSKQKLKHQLFIGKVSEILGREKTTELLRETESELEYATVKSCSTCKRREGQDCTSDECCVGFSQWKEIEE